MVPSSTASTSLARWGIWWLGCLMMVAGASVLHQLHSIGLHEALSFTTIVAYVHFVVDGTAGTLAMARYFIGNKCKQLWTTKKYKSILLNHH